MLVVSNGAFKSGSTWLYNILVEMLAIEPIPEDYLHSGWVNPSIQRDRLETFLTHVDFEHHTYLTKNHYSKPKQRQQLLSRKNVYVLDIERDVKDVLVSAYYHFLRLEDSQVDFETYYWTEGRLVVNRIRDYHQLWGQPHKQVYMSSYRRLKEDFAGEVGRIGTFLNLALTEQAIEEIRQQTSLGSLRKKYSEDGTGENAPPCKVSSNKINFFRKGTVGQWQAYLSPKILADVEAIEKNGLNKFQKAKSKAKLRLFLNPKYC